MVAGKQKSLLREKDALTRYIHLPFSLCLSPRSFGWRLRRLRRATHSDRGLGGSCSLRLGCFRLLLCRGAEQKRVKADPTSLSLSPLLLLLNAPPLQHSRVRARLPHRVGSDTQKGSCVLKRLDSPYHCCCCASVLVELCQQGLSLISHSSSSSSSLVSARAGRQSDRAREYTIQSKCYSPRTHTDEKATVKPVYFVSYRF